MSDLVNSSTRVICQGFAGSQGTLRSEQAFNDNRRRTPQAQQ
jgi:succinyl-CoA synthetase alpha subunit